MYELLYHPRAQKFLVKIPPKKARQIIAKLEILRQNPTSKTLDTKKLVNTERGFRLRVGSIRVIYETSAGKIYIHDIDFRGSIY